MPHPATPTRSRPPRTHPPIDVENAAVLANVKRPARRKSRGAEHAVCTRNRPPWIAQDGIVDAERCGERAIGLRRVNARAEIFCLESAQRAAARSDRFAFFRARARERLRKPCDDDRVAVAEIAEPIKTPIRSRQLEIRREIARLQDDRILLAPARDEVDEPDS